MNRFDSAFFLENIEYFDTSGSELIHKLPEEGSGEIKYGAQLTVRESQAAVLFYKGRVCDTFSAGRYTLKTANLPILTKILSIPWRGDSPLRAEVYFVNLKHFTNLKWGTINPVAFKDRELGLIRLRAHGMFTVQIVQPALFINKMAGTVSSMGAADIEEYLKKIIVSRLNDYLGETLDTILNLAGQFDEMSVELQKRLVLDFARYGLALSNLYITSITPPEEVQKAIDDQGRLNVIKDMEKFIQMKGAMALEKAAENQGETGAGMGMGIGMMMPAMFAQTLNSVSGKGSSQPSAVECQDCHNMIPADARFCPLCGHQQLIQNQCANCGKNLPAQAKYCSRCGHPASEKPQIPICPQCKTENLPGASFCNQCGERLA